MSNGGHETSGERGPSGRLRPVLAAVLRMDLKGSEAAARKDINAFTAFMTLLRQQVNRDIYPSLLGENEGEGDSIRQAFTNIREALQCAFYLRHAAQQPVQTKDDLYTLSPRIVLHFDEFITSEDGRIAGEGQILVTRLDHVVPPGEILATEAFANVAKQVGVAKGYNFAYVGQRELDKNSGNHPCYIVSLVDDVGSSRSFSRPYDPVDLAMRLFDRGDQSSQAGAVEVLATVESGIASHRLMEIALNSEADRRVRHAALVRLQERGDDLNETDIIAISEAFSDEDSPEETRALLLFVLGTSNRRDTSSTLSKIVKDDEMSPRLREAALLAMRKRRGPLVVGAVEYALRDSEEDEVKTAACVVAASGHIKGIEKKLSEIVANHNLPTNLRNVACEALTRQSITRNLNEILEDLAADRDLPLTLRRYAIEGLARSDDPVAVHAVEEIARRTDDDLQVDAMIVLAPMQKTRRRARRRVQEPESHVAEVIQLRTGDTGGPTQAG